MTEQLAEQYLKQRADRLGWGDYDFAIKHIVLSGAEKRQISAPNQVYLLLDCDADVSVESDLGYYSRNQSPISELSEEHTGYLTLINRARAQRRVRFLTGVPRNTDYNRKK